MTLLANAALAPAPRTLPRPGDARRWGRHRGAVADVSTQAWDASPRRRWLQRKAWTFVGAFSERVHVGFAIVDAGYAASAFAYAHDRESGAFVEENAILPFTAPGGGDPDLTRPWRLEARGTTWRLDPHPGGWTARCVGPRLALTVELARGDPGEAITAIAPAEDRPFHHTLKHAALPARVTVERAGHVTASEARGVLDFSKGYPPRHTAWNWAGLTGRATDGRDFGLNLVSGFNDGYENALWIDGRLHALPQAAFAYAPHAPEAPWRLNTLDGAVDVTFRPEGVRAEDVRLGVLESRFKQPYGAFDGVVRVDGRDVRVAGEGVVEEHHALW